MEIVDKINNWLSPPQFETEFQRALASREDGTAQWLFDCEAFTSWLAINQASPSDQKSAHDNVLWISGVF